MSVKLEIPYFTVSRHCQAGSEKQPASKHFFNTFQHSGFAQGSGIFTHFVLFFRINVMRSLSQVFENCREVWLSGTPAD